MTQEEIAALRQRAKDWQAEAATAPASLLTLYDNIVELCLQMTMQGTFLPASEAIEN